LSTWLKWQKPCLASAKPEFKSQYWQTKTKEQVLILKGPKSLIKKGHLIFTKCFKLSNYKNKTKIVPVYYLEAISR
jgi:hypothetical protein